MRSFIFIILLTASFFSYAQPSVRQTERLIELTGEAQLQFNPDIIELSIELKEFKRKDHIIQIEELEEQVTKILQKLAIPAENMKSYSTSGKQYDLLWRKSGLLISKRYTLKLTDVNLFQPLLTELGDADLFSVSVRNVSHTEIEKFRKEVRLGAINEAKDKAGLLVSASGSKLGQVMEIHEVDALDTNPQSEFNRYEKVNDYASIKVMQTNQVYFNQIILHYKIKATFQIE